MTPPMLTAEECVDRVTAATFSGSLEAQFQTVRTPIRVDYTRLRETLREFEGKSRCCEILLKQLGKYRKILDK